MKSTMGILYRKQQGSKQSLGRRRRNQCCPKELANFINMPRDAAEGLKESLIPLFEKKVHLVWDTLLDRLGGI